MGFRILIPIFGAAGIIYGITGISNSNQRSESPASTQSTHEWEVEIGKIGVELDCNGNHVSGTKKATFKWIVDLNEGEKDRLIGGEEINKEAQVSLVAEGEDKALWPNNLNGIKVDTTQYGGILIVKSYYPRNSLGGSGTVKISHREYDESKFICSWTGLNSSQGKEIYRSGMLKGLDHLLVTDQNVGLKVKVSLDGTCTSNEKKKSECRLKVTSNDSYLDWSNKIATKVVLSLK